MRVDLHFIVADNAIRHRNRDEAFARIFMYNILYLYCVGAVPCMYLSLVLVCTGLVLYCIRSAAIIIDFTCYDFNLCLTFCFQLIDFDEQ